MYKTLSCGFLIGAVLALWHGLPMTALCLLWCSDRADRWAHDAEVDEALAEQ